MALLLICFLTSESLKSQNNSNCYKKNCLLKVGKMIYVYNWYHFALTTSLSVFNVFVYLR
jgi:hypothetical protein